MNRHTDNGQWGVVPDVYEPPTLEEIAEQFRCPAMAGKDLHHALVGSPPSCVPDEPSGERTPEWEGFLSEYSGRVPSGSQFHHSKSTHKFRDEQPLFDSVQNDGRTMRGGPSLHAALAFSARGNY